MGIVLKDKYVIPGKIVITAHRGFSGQHPENTIEAFLAAVNLGADILEFDIRGTKDGVPIVLHDTTFARTANRPGSPRDYLLSEIKTFEASYWQGSYESGVKLAEPAVPGASTFSRRDDIFGGRLIFRIGLRGKQEMPGPVFRVFRHQSACGARRPAVFVIQPGQHGFLAGLADAITNQLHVFIT